MGCKGYKKVDWFTEFWNFVAVGKPDQCWIFRGYKGYGSVNIGGKNGHQVSAHRFAFYLHNGYWPNICRHTCDNPPCVNPNHLIDGTKADNNADRKMRGRNSDRHGGNNQMAKLTMEDVEAIRKDTRPGAEIAVQYGVSRHHIYDIKGGRRWLARMS